MVYLSIFETMVVKDFRFFSKTRRVTSVLQTGIITSVIRLSLIGSLQSQSLRLKSILGDNCITYLNKYILKERNTQYKFYLLSLFMRLQCPCKFIHRL